MNIFKRIYAWIVLTLQNPMGKAAINKLHAEFVDSDEGKSAIQQAKLALDAGDKEGAVQEVLTFLKAQIEALAYDPQIQSIALDYLKGLFLSTLKK